MDKRSNEDKLRDMKTRLTQLQNDRRRFEEDWTEAETYADSRVYSWRDLDPVPVRPKRYSSEPAKYKNILVSGLSGYSVSPNIVWFKLGLENQSDQDGYKVKDWLEECEEVLISELNRSNFYDQITKVINDAVVIGHGVMLMERTPEGRLNFTKTRPNEIYLDVNETGVIDTVYRTYQLTLRQAVSFFGLENLDKEYQEAYRDAENWTRKHKFLFAVYPRTDNAGDDPADARNKPFAAYHVDLEHDTIIEESGYDELPYAIFEWSQIPGLAYSTSPAQDGLDEIKLLNIVTKTSMQIAQTSAEPPMRISNSIRHLSIVPRGRNYIADPTEIIEPIRTGENYPITLQEKESIKQTVKDWFNVDFFLMLQSRTGQMTATEVQELQGEKSAVLSNIVVSMNTCLSSIIQRCFSLLGRAGKLPPVPASLQGTGAAMKVDFVGPLSQAQKRYHSMGGIVSALQYIAPVAQLAPESMDIIDTDELMKRMLNGQQMPQAVIREDEDIKKIRAARAQQQAAAQARAQQMEMTGNLMSNAGQLSKAPEDGSLMNMLNRQLAGGMTR